MAASRAGGIILMMFDDDDYLAVLPQPVGEPPAEDEDGMHEAIEQYLRECALNFIAKDAPRREAGSSSTRRSTARPRPTA
jgi:hypothetical protein